MKNAKLLLGVIIIVIILATAYFTFGGGFSITGAFVGPKECVGDDELLYFDACEEWRDNQWTDKPAEFRVLSDTSARQMCDKLLAEYKDC